MKILSQEQLYAADEIFMTGTAVEITPVRKVDHMVIGNGGCGPITKQLQSAYFGLFNGTTDMGEMLRVLGFAQAPRVIGVIPFLGPVAAIWVLVASVVAIREGLDFGTGRAIGTAIGGWLVWVVLQQTVSILVAAIF